MSMYPNEPEQRPTSMYRDEPTLEEPVKQSSSLNEISRFQDGGAGRFAQTFVRQFADSNITFAQAIWIEDYFKNVSDKGLW